jgi:hypothetical protein
MTEELLLAHNFCSCIKSHTVEHCSDWFSWKKCTPTGILRRRKRDNTICSKRFMHTLLMAIPFSSASRMWRDRPPLDCLPPVPSDFLLPPKQEMGGPDPEGSLLPLHTHTCSSYCVRVQGPGSKQWSDTIRAGHSQRQFDESTRNLSIDIIDCRLSLGLRNGGVGFSL